MRNILSHSSKFTQVSVAEDKQLKFNVNVEKHIADLLKDLKNSEGIYKSLRPRGSRFGIINDLCKVHRQLLDNCPSFRRIMSAIKTATYYLAKFLVSLLELITGNMYTVKNIVLKLTKKLLTRTQGFSWPVWMLSPCLPTSH